MTSNTSPGAAGYGINDIWEAAKRDDKASLELEARIDKMRQDIDAGLKLPEKKIDLMESSNRDMTKELGRLIEQILAQGDPTPTDRQMLQALHGRLFECDRRTSLLVKLREVESQGRGERYREFLEGEKSGLGARGKSIPVPLPSSSRSPVKVQKGEPTLKTSIRALMERADPSNTGALQLVVPGHPEIAEYESSDESRSSNGGSGSGTDAESDHAGWPLVYCVLNINPSTPKGNLETGAKKYAVVLYTELLEAELLICYAEHWQG